MTAETLEPQVEEETPETEEDEGPVFDTTSSLKFRTKKFALQHLLEKAASVVPTRDLLPVLKNFMVVAQPGLIRVAATDLELSVVAVSEMVSVEGAGSAVFPAKRLLEIVREAEDGELEINVDHGEAHIAVGRTSWTLKLMPSDEYPPLPDADDIEFTTIDRGKFIGSINSVKYAAATETVRPSLMLIDVTNGQMRASDGVRFQQVKVEPNIPDIQIPINAVDDLLKILRTTESNEVELGEDDNSLVFRVAGDIFVAQKLTAIFPDVDSQLVKPALLNDQKLNVDREDLVAAIKRVRITADPETSAIVLELGKNKLTVRSKDKYGSTATEELDVFWEGPERQVAFNHVHLIQMLDMLDLKSCPFFLGTDTKTRPTPLLIRDDSNGLIGVLNQLRVDWLQS